MRSGGTLQKNRLQPLLSPGGTLSQRVVRGGFWVFALRIVDRLFKLVRTIVLARLLAPEDFGLFGIALLAMSALETFSQTGFQQALIQKKRDIRPYLDTAWTVQAIRGAFLALVLFGIGPYVAAFFGEPAAALLLRVLGLSMLFQGFANIGVIYFQKELQFHKQFGYQLSGTLVDLVVAITAAVLLRSAWALIFGLLAGNFVRMGVSYLIHPYRPRLRLEGAKARELYGFGRWILGTSIMTFLFNQGDDAFLGKVLGVAALGSYQMAYRIGQMPATEFAKVISKVTFPTYSIIQEDVSRLKAGFLKTLNITAILTIPLAGVIFVLAAEFTRIFLTEKWMPMVPALRILVIAGMLRALINTGGTLYQGRGMPNINFKVSFLRLSTMAIVMYPLTLFLDMSGVALAVALGNLACVPIWLMETARITKASFRDYFEEVLPSIVGTGVMGLVIFLLKSAMEINLLGFIIAVVFAIAAYLGSMFMLEKRCNMKVFRDLRFLITLLRGINK